MNVIKSVYIFTLFNMILQIFSILLIICQSEACLDLLVRSFNEIFSPIIETSENRIEKFHDVDELTNHYKRDENGKFILRSPYLRGIKPGNSKNDNAEILRSVFEHAVSKGVKNTRFVGCHSSTEKNPVTVKPHDEQNSNENNLEYPCYEDGNFIPIYEDPSGAGADEGDIEYDIYEDDANANDDYFNSSSGSFLDLLIKMIEMFQVTATSEIIVSEPRHVSLNNMNQTKSPTSDKH